MRRAHPTVVGEFRLRRRGAYVVPHDARIRQWIEIPDGMAIPPGASSVHRVGDRVRAEAMEIHSEEDMEGMIVNAEIVDWGEEGDRPAAA